MEFPEPAQGPALQLLDGSGAFAHDFGGRFQGQVRDDPQSEDLLLVWLQRPEKRPNVRRALRCQQLVLGGIGRARV